jgi:hypothetical protein
MSTTAPIITQPPPDLIQSSGAPIVVRFVRMELPRASEQGPSQPHTIQPGSRPERILLGTLSDLGFRVVKPIEVLLETREDAVIASWQMVDEFGTGTSVSSAATDLGRTVAELYRTLQSDSTNLGPDLRRVWQQLQEFVVPRR